MAKNPGSRNGGAGREVDTEDDRLGSVQGASPAPRSDSPTERGMGVPMIDAPDDGVIRDAPQRLVSNDSYARYEDDGGRQDREHNERDYSDAERLEMFRLQMFQNMLPSLPKMEGWHLCWLTTANPRDSIQKRLQLGYELLTPDMLPGWEHSVVPGGEFGGCIGVNEMVAARLPLRLYELYMTEAHHNAPLAEEGKLTATLDAIREQAKGAKTQVFAEEGFAALQQRPGRARFEEVEPRR